MSDMTASVGSIIKGHCPKCGPERNAVVRGSFNRSISQDDTDWSCDYYILECPACEDVYFQTDSVFSEDWDFHIDPITGEDDVILKHDIQHFPAAETQERPQWMGKLLSTDSDLFRLLEDTYTAIDNNLLILAAIGIRTVFDRESELLKVDPAITFEEKLKELQCLGKIGQSEHDDLKILTDAGSAAAHRGWRPTAAQIATMLEIVESFTHRTFIIGDAGKTLRANIPQKPKRKSNITKPSSATTMIAKAAPKSVGS